MLSWLYQEYYNNLILNSLILIKFFKQGIVTCIQQTNSINFKVDNKEAPNYQFVVK